MAVDSNFRVKNGIVFGTTTVVANSTTWANGVMGTVTETYVSGSYTFNKNANSLWIEVVVIGAGGGASGCGIGLGNPTVGAGGGGGGLARNIIPSSSLRSSEPYVVGAAGVGGANGTSAATNGGDSSFGNSTSSFSELYALGGAAGANSNFPGSGGVGANGQINLYGGTGSAGKPLNNYFGNPLVDGADGGEVPGWSPRTPILNLTASGANGINGAWPGGGGQGGAAIAGGNHPGGNGANGGVIIWEYYSIQ